MQLTLFYDLCCRATGWRRLIGCLNILRWESKRATIRKWKRKKEREREKRACALAHAQTHEREREGKKD